MPTGCVTKEQYKKYIKNYNKRVRVAKRNTWCRKWGLSK